MSATVAASPVAPAIISPTPIGMLAVIHKITPKTNIAVLTPTINAAFWVKNDVIALPIVFAFTATSAASPTAPATINPIDIGVTCPKHTSNTPITSIPMLNPVISAAFSIRKFDITSPTPEPLCSAASATPNMVAPAIINPIPHAILPIKSNIKPTATNAAPAAFIIIVSVVCIPSDAASSPLKSGLFCCVSSSVFAAAFCSLIKSSCSCNWSIISLLASILSSKASVSLSSLCSVSMLSSSKSARERLFAFSCAFCIFCFSFFCFDSSLFSFSSALI